MINYEIYPQGKCQDVRPDYTIRLQLVENDGGVVVRAVEKNGDPIVGGNLIEFESDGTLFRYGGIARRLGFQLKTNTKIKCSNE